MNIRKNKALIIMISLFLILILSGTIGHYYYLNQDYSQKFIFLVTKKEINAKGNCDLFDKNNSKLPLKSFMFYQSQVYEGDSLVKKANSYFVYVYRKSNWRDYGSDESYFVAEKINLN